MFHEGLFSITNVCFFECYFSRLQKSDGNSAVRDTGLDDVGLAAFNDNLELDLTIMKIVND
jgi:hypothetical protein